MRSTERSFSGGSQEWVWRRFRSLRARLGKMPMPSGSWGPCAASAWITVITVNERQVYRIVSNYARYYNRARTHLALAKDAPEPRRVQSRTHGRVVAFPEVGGLHHRYARVAA